MQWRLFVLGSIGCVFAPNLNALVLARVLDLLGESERNSIITYSSLALCFGLLLAYGFYAHNNEKGDFTALAFPDSHLQPRHYRQYFYPPFKLRLAIFATAHVSTFIWL